MPKLRHRLPKCRRHPATNQAIVTIDNRMFYLGPFDSKRSRAEYDRIIAEWLSNGRRLPDEEAAPTVNELILAYWQFAQNYYRKPDGSPTSEIENIRQALRPLRRLYGPKHAAEFGPLALVATRQAP